IEEIGEMIDIYYVRQKKPLGLGDAILHAEKHVNSEPFAVLLGDDIILSQKPAIAQLMEVAEKRNAPVIGVETVPWNLVSRYGIIDGEQIENGLYRIRNLVEKPSPDGAPSNIAIIGRYILSPEIFDVLRETPPGKGGEIQLTDALKFLLQGKEMFAKKINGRRYDVGSKVGFIITNIELSIAREDLRNHVLQHMEKILREVRDG
ncbi:UTP--glucose-1-phosphate uridylyltransferase, partial [Thermococci archaeon]